MNHIKVFFKKNPILLTLISLFCIFITSCHIDPNSTHKEYLIVLDAGSSGTRLHLFEYPKNANRSVIHQQAIKELLNIKTTPGISSFAHNLSGLSENLSPLLHRVQEKLKENSIGMHTVPLLFYSTAGMRLLPQEEQQAIYSEIRKALKKYEFDVKEIKTIDGKMEGLYAWLGVNYLSNSFDKEHTNGILEMGGASMQIAFELYDHNSKCQENDTISCVFMNDKMHKVFSASFLGLGQNTALNAINTQKNAGACYPKDYPEVQNTNGFDFDECATFYQILLDKAGVQGIVPEHEKNAHFFALSSFGYLADFFNITQPVQKEDLKSRVQKICSKDWTLIQTECNDNQICREQFRPYMHTYCLLGVSFQTLMHEQYYKIKDDDVLYAQSKINGVMPDWSLGVAVYHSVHK